MSDNRLPARRRAGAEPAEVPTKALKRVTPVDEVKHLLPRLSVEELAEVAILVEALRRAKSGF
jgi:hypothetical protein